MIQNTEEFLTHYGVKGMKWGERKAADKNFNAWGAALTTRVAEATMPISEADYKSLPNKPVKLGDKNSVYKRIAAPGNTELGAMVYVTNNDKDHNTYKAFFPGSGDKKFMFDKAALTVKADKDLVSPGRKERIDIFVEALGKTVVTETGAVMTGREWAFGSNESAALRALSNHQVGLQSYNSFAQSQHSRTPLHNAYFDTVKAKGYNAIFDDADGGFVSKTPIIMFPEKANARVTEVKMLSKDDVLRARLDLTPGSI